MTDSLPVTNLSMSNLSGYFGLGNSLGSYTRGAIEQSGNRLWAPYGAATANPVDMGGLRGSRYAHDISGHINPVIKGTQPGGNEYAMFGYHSGYSGCTLVPAQFGGLTYTSNIKGEVIDRMTSMETGTVDQLNVSFSAAGQGPYWILGPRFQISLNGLVFDSANAAQYSQTSCEGYSYRVCIWTNIPRTSWATAWADLQNLATPFSIIEVG